MRRTNLGQTAIKTTEVINIIRMTSLSLSITVITNILTSKVLITKVIPKTFVHMDPGCLEKKPTERTEITITMMTDLVMITIQAGAIRIMRSLSTMTGLQMRAQALCWTTSGTASPGP